jgi:hypothetical protein
VTPAPAEPERDLIRRIAPVAPVVAVLAFVVAALVSGAGAGWSAAIAIAVVTANFVASAAAVAWAASISPMFVAIVALGGYVVRLGVIVGLMVALQHVDWFSIGAFLAALVPATVALLVVEAKLLGGRVQADLWRFPDAQEAHR